MVGFSRWRTKNVNPIETAVGIFHPIPIRLDTRFGRITVLSGNGLDRLGSLGLP